MGLVILRTVRLVRTIPSPGLVKRIPSRPVINTRVMANTAVQTRTHITGILTLSVHTTKTSHIMLINWLAINVKNATLCGTPCQDIYYEKTRYPEGMLPRLNNL